MTHTNRHKHLIQAIIQIHLDANNSTQTIGHIQFDTQKYTHTHTATEKYLDTQYESTQKDIKLHT